MASCLILVLGEKDRAVSHVSDSFYDDAHKTTDLFAIGANLFRGYPALPETFFANAGLL